MDPALLALAFAASTLPALLAWTPGGELTGASQLGLALTAWLALAGVPSSARLANRMWITTAFALPPLALAAALDLRGGGELAQLAPAWLEGVALLGGLAFASRRAAWATGKITLYDGAWLLAVVAPVCLQFALNFGVGAEGAPSAVAQLAQWSPLGWALDLCAGASEPHEHAWRPMLVVVVLAAIAVRGWRPREARE